MRILALLSALLLSACGGGGASAPPAPARLVVAGDSITLRTGQCAPNDSFESCAQSGRLPVEAAYSSYLSGPSFALVANAGRGGDTCTDQAAYTNGPFAGQPRGLLHRLGASVLAHAPEWTVVLIGVNDRGLFDVPVEQVADCLSAVWSALRAGGSTPIAATYPPIDAGTPVWGLPYGEGKRRATDLNTAIRQAATKAGVMVIELENVRPYSTTDGVHPDAAGARAIAAEVNRALRGMA